MALKKAQRVKLSLQSGTEKVVQEIKQETDNNSNNDDPQAGSNIVLNATAEFCRTLGDIPTYGLAGNREENVQELMVKIFFYPGFFILLQNFKTVPFF